MNSKRVLGLNGKPKAITLSEEKWKKVCNGVSRKVCRNDTKSTACKKKMDKLDFKIISFCSAKDTAQRMTREAEVWEKIFANNIYETDLHAERKAALKTQH